MMTHKPTDRAWLAVSSNQSELCTLYFGPFARVARWFPWLGAPAVDEVLQRGIRVQK